MQTNPTDQPADVVAVSEENVQKAKELKEKGNDAYRDGRYAEAVELFRSQIVINIDRSSTR